MEDLRSSGGGDRVLLVFGLADPRKLIGDCGGVGEPGEYGAREARREMRLFGKGFAKRIEKSTTPSSESDEFAFVRCFGRRSDDKSSSAKLRFLLTRGDESELRVEFEYDDKPELLRGVWGEFELEALWRGRAGSGSLGGVCGSKSFIGENSGVDGMTRIGEDEGFALEPEEG